MSALPVYKVTIDPTGYKSTLFKSRLDEELFVLERYRSLCIRYKDAPETAAKACARKWIALCCERYGFRLAGV